MGWSGRHRGRCEGGCGEGMQEEKRGKGGEGGYKEMFRERVRRDRRPSGIVRVPKRGKEGKFVHVREERVFYAYSKCLDTCGFPPTQHAHTTHCTWFNRREYTYRQRRYTYTLRIHTALTQRGPVSGRLHIHTPAAPASNMRRTLALHTPYHTT